MAVLGRAWVMRLPALDVNDNVLSTHLNKTMSRKQCGNVGDICSDELLKVTVANVAC
jgi:hypothetical protein